MPIRSPTLPRAADRPASASSRPTSERRLALDGIRAVAVLAVMGYHLTTRLPGGFLGVDVFFVLSGYLITGLLLAERARSGRIHLGNFWARRARRLLPAVILLVVACALVTSLRDPATTFGARRADMIATLLYYANWHFIAADQSYFALFTGQSPLTHTWTLAIEEQFYLAWPIVVLLVAWLFRNRLRALLLVSVAGMAASAVWMATHYDAADPTRVYFATGSRAHELLAGAVLAILVARQPELLHSPRSRRLATWIWPLVAVVVAGAFVLADDRSRLYYGAGSLAFALVVAVGIWAAEAAPRSLPARALSLAPVAWVGAISYGLYLWHWPVIQWLTTSSHFSDGHVRKVAEVGLTFAVATASYYVVERPVRAGRVPWLRLSARRLALVAPVALALTLVVVVRATSVPESIRLATQVQANLDKVKCPAGSPAPVPGYPWCIRHAAPAGAPVVATIGDSTAEALQPGVEQLASERDWGYVQAGRNRCSLLPLVIPSDPADAAAVAQARECIAAIPRLLDDVRRHERPDVWLASDRWMLLPLLDGAGHVIMPEDPRHEALASRSLRARLASLTSQGEQVVMVVIPPPGAPAECSLEGARPASCTSTAHTIRDPVTARARAIVQRAAAASGGSVVAVRIDDVVCPGGRCPATIGGELVRYDGIHFTEDFSRKIAPVIVERAERAGVDFARRAP